jgi:prepilin-type N-terminal cleavage/methylation domain-containing protein
MTKAERNPNGEVRRPAKRIGAFTLIELLVVIAVIALLAAMIIPITGRVTKLRIRNRARTEMEKIVTAIESYKAKYGFYPPDNPGYPSTNQLFFELVGTTLDQAGNYTTKDGSSKISAANITAILGPGVTGFNNCTRGAASDDGQQAKTFLNNLNPSQKTEIGTVGGGFYVLTGKPDWSGGNPPITIANNMTVNPWRYVSSKPVNNRNEFDLWIDVVVGGETNRICNWTKQVLINPP